MENFERHDQILVRLRISKPYWNKFIIHAFYKLIGIATYLYKIDISYQRSRSESMLVPSQPRCMYRESSLLRSLLFCWIFLKACDNSHLSKREEHAFWILCKSRSFWKWTAPTSLFWLFAQKTVAKCVPLYLRCDETEKNKVSFIVKKKHAN